MLKELIESKGYTLPKFAKELQKAWAKYSGRKCSKMIVYQWCEGSRHPAFRPVELREFLKLLDIDIDQLIDILATIEAVRDVEVLPQKASSPSISKPNNKYANPKKKSSVIS